MSRVQSSFGANFAGGPFLPRLFLLLAIACALLMFPCSAYAADGEVARNEVLAQWGGLVAQVVVAVAASAIMYPRVRLMDQQDIQVKALQATVVQVQRDLALTREQAALHVQRSELDAIRKEVRAEMAELRTEMRADLAEVRGEIAQTNEKIGRVLAQNERLLAHLIEGR